MWGQAGVLTSATVLGLTDVDALTVSMARGVAYTASFEVAAIAIALGVLSNTVLKLAVALFFGSQPFKKIAGGTLALMIVAAAASVALPSLTDSRPVQHVCEAPVKPRFTFGVIVPGVDRLSEHMRILAAHSRHFLFQSNARLRHQILIALIPELRPVHERARDAGACRFNGVLADDFRVQRGQIPMPVDRL